MRPTNQIGVFEDRGFMWTLNRTPGKTVYEERIRTWRGEEFRHWNIFRSKIAALIQKDPNVPWINTEADVLYLGASTGTTVSHVSDVLGKNSLVYAVEFSSRSARDLMWNLESRTNVVPILQDAGKPEAYQAYIDKQVGCLIQDVAQRHQVEIFLRNLQFLQKGGLGYLFIKARSINVATPVEVIYQEVARRLEEAGLQILKEIRLDPYEKDHCAFVIRKP